MAKGFDKASKRISAAADVAAEVTRALYAAGQMIEIDAERSITDGSISGAGHIPSLPGQPPNADTRHLDGNIETEIKTDAAQPTVTVTSKAAYASALEWGTSKMAERPYMRPATNRNRDNVAAKVADAVSIKVKRGG